MDVVRVEFTAPFNWDPPERRGRTTFSFAAGMVLPVRGTCARAAIAAGCALATDKPATDDAQALAFHPLLAPRDGDEPPPPEAEPEHLEE